MLDRPSIVAAWRRSLVACVLSLLACGLFASSALAASYSDTQTIAVPPASNFSGAAGGDGWAIALSSDRVYNVLHHQSDTKISCHLQSDAQPCWSTNPEVVTDPNTNASFKSGSQPGMYLDQQTGKLYVYATRSTDSTVGVVCVDTALANANPNTNEDPYCGFTPLSGIGEGAIEHDEGVAEPAGYSRVSSSMLVGTHFYAFNWYPGAAAGAGLHGSENTMLCFDTSTGQACSGQPYAVNIGGAPVPSDLNHPSPTPSAIGHQLIVPVNGQFACLDDATQTNCAGSWPATVQDAGTNSTGNFGVGPIFPMLDGAGNVTGACLQTVGDPCVSTSGAAVATPQGLANAVQGPGGGYNGPSVTLGTRIYVPQFGNGEPVYCYDYSTAAACANFPKSLANNNLGGLYTVNTDPQRPTCLWVNADGGGAQIQNFDAYTGGACGQGSTRVLTQQFIVPQSACNPVTYQSLQVVSPSRSQYTSGTVQIDDGGGNPIAGIPIQNLDGTGSVALSGLGLNNNNGVPQFVITLNGLPPGANQLTVTLNWTAPYSAGCTKPGQTVVPYATLTNPISPGGVCPLIDATQPLTWGAVTGGQGFALRIGTTQGGTDLLNVTGLPASQVSYLPAALPSGLKLWARLYTKINGVYANNFDDACFTVSPMGSYFTAPVNGGSAGSPSQAFTWSSFGGAQGYLLRVGTTEGGFDLANVTLVSATHSYTVNNLPPGRTLWARLYTKVGGVYGNRYQDISFTTGGGPRGT